VLQHPGGALEAQGLHGEAELGLGDTRNQLLRGRCEFEQLGAAPHRCLAYDRHLLVEREVGHDLHGGDPVAACQIEHAVGVGVRRREVSHLRHGIILGDAFSG
jgi:hypothetical protein